MPQYTIENQLALLYKEMKLITVHFNKLRLDFPGSLFIDGDNYGAYMHILLHRHTFRYLMLPLLNFRFADNRRFTSNLPT